MQVFRGTQASWKGLEYFDRPQDRPFAEGGDDNLIQCACQWGTVSNAASGMGKAVRDCYGVSPWGIFVRPDSKIFTPDDLADVPIAVGMRAGSHFGELSAIGPRQRTARIIAVERSTVAVMPRDSFLSMLMNFPQVSVNLLRDLAYVISSMNERVSVLSKTNPRQRVYIELLRLAVPNPRGDGSWIIEPLPHHNNIAAWAGTEQQEVAEAIGKLAREKIVERKNRTIIIRDRARIESLSGM